MNIKSHFRLPKLWS